MRRTVAFLALLKKAGPLGFACLRQAGSGLQFFLALERLSHFLMTPLSALLCELSVSALSVFLHFSPAVDLDQDHFLIVGHNCCNGIFGWRQ